MILSAIQHISIENGSTLLINKPLRWTSFDVVNKLKHEIRKQTGIKKIKIGHAGTLDPLATGLLIICIGKHTKKISEYQNLNKQYTGTFVVGATTESYDLEHPPINFCSLDNITPSKIENAVNQLTGTILQTPPLHSAVKLQGKSAFDYARQGINIELRAKEITIHSFEITRLELPEIDFKISCSKGTYIRSIARDLGCLLECGAYLKTLVRTHIGSFSLENAYDLTPLFSEQKTHNPNRKKKNFEV